MAAAVARATTATGTRSVGTPGTRGGTKPWPEEAPCFFQRRELTLSVPRVELRLYRRTHTSSDVVSDPPHFVYIVRCEWTGERRLGREPASSSGSPRSPRSPSGLCFKAESEALAPGFEAPWPWWDLLPETYAVRRRWPDIVRFHKALANDLAYDSLHGRRRVKARVPTLPDRGDLNSWLQGYAAIGDACCLGRPLPSDAFPKEREHCLQELRDLHWMYVMNRLSPYFAEVNAILQELPTDVLAGSTALRRFVTGGVSGRRQESVMPVQPRFFGPMLPVQPPREDIAAAVQMLRRAGSAPALGPARRADSKSRGRKSPASAGGSGDNPTSPSSAAAKLVLGAGGGGGGKAARG